MRAKAVLALRVVILILLIFGYFYESIKDLDTDVINPDGINWHTRTQTFTKAFITRKYDQMYQVYHPGITLMWLSGPVVSIFRPMDFTASTSLSKTTFIQRDYYTKLSLVIFGAAVLVLIAACLWKLAGFKYCTLFVLVFSLEPFVIGMRRLYHLDYLMTLPLFLTFLLILYYSYKSAKWFLPAAGGLFFALAVLTKTTAVMFLPVSLFIFLLGNPRTVKKLTGITTFLISTVVFMYLLFPPVWKNPIKLVPKYIDKMVFGVTDIGIEGKKEMGSSGRNESVTLDDTLSAKDPAFYITSLFMRLSPSGGILVILSLGTYLYFLLKGFGLIVYRSIITRKILKVYTFSPEAWVCFWSLCFTTASLAALTLSVKKTDRYEILVFPFLLTLVAYLLNKIKIYWTGVFVLGYVYVVLIEILIIHPYYLAYSNPYLGGLETRLRVLDDAPFGIGTYAAFNVVRQDLASSGNFGYYTVSGPKSVKAISVNGKFSRYPSCVTDYSVVYAFDDKPTYMCSQKYSQIGKVTIDGFDYWYIYKRLNQKHESNYD